MSMVPIPSQTKECFCDAMKKQFLGAYELPKDKSFRDQAIERLSKTEWDYIEAIWQVWNMNSGSKPWGLRQIDCVYAAEIHQPLLDLQSTDQSAEWVQRAQQDLRKIGIACRTTKDFAQQFMTLDSHAFSKFWRVLLEVPQKGRTEFVAVLERWAEGLDNYCPRWSLAYSEWYQTRSSDLAREQKEGDNTKLYYVLMRSYELSWQDVLVIAEQWTALGIKGLTEPFIEALHAVLSSNKPGHKTNELYGVSALKRLESKGLLQHEYVRDVYYRTSPVFLPMRASEELFSDIP